MIQSLAYFTTILHKDFAEYCNGELQKMGLSQGLLYFILYAGKHPGCAPKELAGALRMDMGHTTRTLSKLVQGGFLNQETDPHDRRSHKLTLAPPGEAAFKASYDLFTQWDSEIMSTLSKDEQELLIKLLLRVSYQKGGADLVQNNS